MNADQRYPCVARLLQGASVVVQILFGIAVFVMLNRIQGMIIEPFDYPTLEEKQIRDLTTIIEFNDPPVPHGLIMSQKALPAAEQEKWRALVNAMRADGTMQRIFEKYFKPDMAAAMVNF